MARRATANRQEAQVTSEGNRQKNYMHLKSLQVEKTRNSIANRQEKGDKKREKQAVKAKGINCKETTYR